MNMDAKTLADIKAQLLVQKNQIELELSKISSKNPKAAETKNEVEFRDIGNEEGDNAAEVAQFSDNLSMEDELEKAVRDIDGALKTIAEGTYGTCKYCKQPIDERRLIARPTSSSCIQCKKTLTQEM